MARHRFYRSHTGSSDREVLSMNDDVAINAPEQLDNVQPDMQAPQEKMLSQSEVNALIGSEKRKAADAERRRLEQMYAQNGSQGQQMQQPGFDKESLMNEMMQKVESSRKAEREAAEAADQKRRVDELAQTYMQKMNTGKDLYEDFDKVVGAFNPSNFPHLTVLAAQMDNLPEIMYDINKNRQKLVTLNALAKEDPELAREELEKLSKSIKDNDAALRNNQKTSSPLKQLKTSTIAGSDSGKRSISDLRKDSKYRV